MQRSTPVAIALASLLVAGRARADELPSVRYKVDPIIDLPVLAISGAVASSWLLSPELGPGHCAPLCRREDLNVFDRPVAGVYRPGWKTVSDLSIAFVLVSAGAATVVDGGVPDGLSDLVIVGESVLLANGLGVVAQMGVRRPRPLLYGDRAPLDVRNDGNAAPSFFSGHTASAFAGSISAFWMLRARHPRGALPYVALFSGIALSSFVGTSRVLAGDHFPTDVFMGAIVGSSLGTLVPALHRVAVRAEPIADMQGRFAGIGLRYQPPH